MLNRKIEERSKLRERHDKPTNERFARFRRLFQPSRYGAIPFIVLLVGIYAAVRIAAPFDTQHAQLRFIENGGAKTFDGETGSQISYREPLSGTAYETAVRLREAGALGLAVSLSVFAKQAATGNVPADHRDVIQELIARKLMPPGIDAENGSFRSTVNELRFRYRGEPLSFEILALPKDGTGGSALLLRFPLPTGESNSVMYFESGASAQAPAPFSTNEQITAAGWRIRHWRGDALPLNEAVVRELREQNKWLKSTNQSR